MINRIQELANQAKADVPDGLAVDKWIETYNEKFAELIIRDIHAYVDARDTAQILSRGILKMYGMEE